MDEYVMAKSDNATDPNGRIVGTNHDAIPGFAQGVVLDSFRLSLLARHGVISRVAGGGRSVFVLVLLTAHIDLPHLGSLERRRLVRLAEPGGVHAIKHPPSCCGRVASSRGVLSIEG